MPVLYHVKKIIYCLFFYYSSIIATSIVPGPTSVYLQNDHLVLYDTEKVQGFVRLNNGFTIANSGLATLDTFITVSGGIDLRDSGQLQLLSDLLLDSGVTLSSGGKIRGHGRSIILHGNLTIPANKTLQITGNTIIEGNGNTLFLDQQAQLFIDTNVTLTLKNLTFKTTHNSLDRPAILFWDHSSGLALDDIVIAPSDDVYIRNGQFFAYNDVLFTGTSRFIYQSSQPMYIMPHATLGFDLGTTFSFEPLSTSKDLLVLTDQTSQLYLNGSTFQVTTTGCRLTKGRLIFDNHVSLASPRNYTINGFSGETYNASWFESGDTGGSTSPIALGIACHPTNNQYLAAVGRFGYMVKLYMFNGSSITRVFREAWPTSFTNYGPRSCAWRPQGDYLAVVGQRYLKFYEFTGGTLVGLAPVDVGGAASYRIQSVSWSPDGAYLAIGTQNNIRIYSFNSGIATLLYTLPSTWGLTWGLAWTNVSGYYLTTCGEGGVCNLYSWHNNTLSYVTNITDLPVELVFSASWSPDGRFMSVGYYSDFRLYEWSGGTFTRINNSHPGFGGQVTSVPLSWNKGEKYILVGVSGPITPNTDTQLWKFQNNEVTPISMISCGGCWLQQASWSAQGTYVAAGTLGPANRQIQIYTINYTQSTSSGNGSFIFGNSILGPDYDLDVRVLGNAQVNINGKVNYDPA